jgi:hypothetical protein
MFDPNLGPLGPLLGVWEGESGIDLAPSDKPATDRQLATSKYRERMTFEPTGRVDNHEQQMYGLRYTTRAWRIGAPDPFHEEVGYWLWDPASKLVLRSFMPPRGMAILAGGHAEPTARAFALEATAGSHTLGICSSPFLVEQFKTERYTLQVTLVDDNTLHYEQHTYLRMKGRSELFDHRDDNTLRRAS